MPKGRLKRFYNVYFELNKKVIVTLNYNVFLWF